MFSSSFLAVAVHGGLVLVAGSALTLVGLWLRDHRSGRLW
jgi:hypothetical protein